MSEWLILWEFLAHQWHSWMTYDAGSHPRVGGVWRSDSLTSTLRWAGVPQSPYGAFRPVKSYKPFESYRISREPYKLSYPPYPPYRTGPALASAYGKSLTAQLKANNLPNTQPPLYMHPPHVWMLQCKQPTLSYNM